MCHSVRKKNSSEKLTLNFYNVCLTGWLSKYKPVAIIWTIHSAKTLFDFIAGRCLHSYTTTCRRINFC